MFKVIKQKGTKMQTIIKVTADDVKNKLVGRYLVEINNDNYDDTILTEEGEIKAFHVEKRISILTLVSGQKEKYQLSGNYYNHTEALTAEEMAKHINQEEGTRHYRLMTIQEIMKLHIWLKEKK